MFIYSVSKFFNAVQKDFIIDWLEMYGKTCGFYKKTSEFQQKLFQSGIETEDHIINLLKQKFLPQLSQDVSDGTCQKFQNIPHIFTDLTHLKFQNFTHRDKTLKSIQSIDKPFMIYQGLLCGSDEFGNKRPYGIPDLIMRKDILHTLMNKPVEQNDENDYVIVDIKKSLKLNKNNTVSKSTNNYKWLEFQLCIYEKFLSEELKRPPQSVYVMSIDDTNNILIGKIQYVEQDIKQHIDYLKQLKSDGDKWIPYPKPTNNYMYPNMKNTYDFVWREAKLDIARRIGELTLLPYVSYEVRTELWKHDIKSYKDEKCIDILKTINKVPSYVQEIIKANQDIGLEINAEKVKTELEEQISNRKLIFVDIETSQKGQAFLSCIYNNDSKQHTHFYCNKSEMMVEGVNKVLQETRNLLKQYDSNGYCVVFYAGQEEKILDIENGVDLYKILRKHNYAKSGVFSYQLKEIYNNTFRRTIETKILNGLEAMNKFEEDDEKHKNDLCEYVKKDVDIMVKLVSRFLNY